LKNQSITAAKAFKSGRMGAIAASGKKFRTEPTFAKVLKDIGEQWVQLAVF